MSLSRSPRARQRAVQPVPSQRGRVAFRLVLLAIMWLMMSWAGIAPVAAAAFPNAVTVPVASGFSAIGNNYQRGGNTLNEVIPRALDGTQIFKWNAANQSYDISTYDALAAAWSPNVTLAPGEGAFISSPGAQTLTFGGSILPPGPSTRPSSAALRLVSARVPAPSSFEEMMGFAPVEGDRVLSYEGVFQSVPAQPTSVSTFRNGTWAPQAPNGLPGGAQFIDLVGIIGPMFLTQPQSQTVEEGDSVVFSVTVGGTAPIQYQWRKDGVNIAGATSPSWQIPRAAQADAGSYSVAVSNPGGTAISDNAVLTVALGSCPVLVCPPNIVTNCQGPGGTVVTFSPKGGNLCNPEDFEVVCAPPSGAVFPLGTTVVQCAGRAPRTGRQAPCSFTVTVTGSCPPAQCSNNLLVNGSFELPGSADGWIDVPGGSSLIPGWNSLLNGLEYYNPSANRWGALDGSAARDQFVVDLTPFQRNGGGLAQTFPTIPNKEYRVSFYMSTLQRSGRDGTATLTAQAGDTIQTFHVENHTPTHLWELKVFAFTADPSGLSTLSFLTTEDSALHFVMIDDVRVSDCCDRIDCPPDIYVPCQGNGGANVEYAIRNRTICGNAVLNLAHWCEPPSGSFFLTGATRVTCTDSNKLTGELAQCSFLVTVSGDCQARCLPPPSSLLAWWRAEDNAQDYVGSSHGERRNGADFEEGRVGRTFRFDGVDDYVSVPDSPLWNLGMNDFTIEFWTRLDTIKSSMFIDQQSGDSPGGFEFDLQPDHASGSLLVFARNPRAAGITRLWSPTAGIWYHLAVTRQAGAYRLYVDAELLGDAQPDPNPVQDVTGELHLGGGAYQETGGLRYGVDGLIDEMSIYGRALSETELRGIVQARQVGKCIFPGCVDIHCPGNLSVNCQGNAGAMVSYTVAATNYCGAHEVGVVCDPPSNSLFPPGTTFVHCTASSSNETAHCSFAVSVLGSCAQGCLELRCPDPIRQEATDATGALVHFAPFATNRCQPQDLATGCAPPSGHHFDIGTTIVHCWATGGGQTMECKFPIVVTNTNKCEPPPVVAYNIRGAVTNSNGQPVDAVRVTMQNLDGPDSGWTVTDAGGHYTLTGAAGVKYRVSASAAGYTAVPAATEVGPLTADAVADFLLVRPFENWQRSHWGAPLGPEADANADPDRDHLRNLVEYATGSDPLASSGARGLTVTFSRVGTPHVTVELEVSPEATDIMVKLQVNTRSFAAGPWLDALSYYPAGPDGASAPTQEWTLPLVRPMAIRALPAPRRGVAVDLTAFAELAAFRMSVCLLSECGALAASGEARPPTGDSLRIGFMNVQFMDTVAEFAGELLNEFDECCGGCDRGGEIARRVVAGDYDVVALAEAWVDGDGLVARVMETMIGSNLEEKARHWARAKGITDEREIERIIERWECNLAPDGGNTKGRLIEVLGRAGYTHRVEKLDDFANLQDSGLMLFSRWPFERLPDETRGASRPYIHSLTRASNGTEDWGSEVAFIEYPLDHCHAYECQSAKGAGLVRVRNPYTSRVFNVVFTHTEAADEGPDQSARHGQMGDIKTMLENVLGDRMRTEPILVVGDLNIKGSLSPFADSRPEWEAYFSPAAGEWDGFFRNSLGDAWERQVATVGDAHAIGPTGIGPVPPAFRDPGLTGGADRHGTQRYDYLLVNDPSLVSLNQTQHLTVQHLAVAYDLMGDPTDTPTAFGFAGTRILSDHYGLVADINLRTEQGSPYLAHVEPDLQHEDERGKSYPASIRLPGAMQWWRFDAPGTYSFGVAPNGLATTNDFEVMVFSSRDLSRPLRPITSYPRIVVSDVDCREVIGTTYHVDDTPLYVRVRHQRRSELGSFDLVARRHQCVSQEDFCTLHPNLPPMVVAPLPLTVGDRERWFRLQTECPTSRRSQAIFFETQPAEGFDALTHLVGLETDHGGSLEAIVDPARGEDAVGLLKADFAEGGAVVWGRVAPLSGARAPFLVRWTNNLTVFDPQSIRNDVPLDNDILWDNQDDEFGRITLTLQSPGSASPWTRTIDLFAWHHRFEDFNNSHRRDVDLEHFPTVRFLPDELLTIRFDEFDDTLTFADDTMTARVPALGADAPGVEKIDVIQNVEGDGGRYQIYGHKRHFGSRDPLAPFTCEP